MRKLNKKGFTLVELLAVIAILAVLMLLVTPSVLKLFTEGKQSAFVTQVQSVWKAAENQYVKDALTSTTPGPYCYAGSTLTNKENTDNTKFATATTTENNKLDITDNKSLAYFVKFDSNGKIEQIIVTDGSYYYNGKSETNKPLSIDIKYDSTEANSDVKKVKDGETFTCNATTGTGSYTTK